MTIGNGVINIGYGAFGGCISLSSVIIPDSVTNIDVYAFVHCISLTSLTIGSGVKSIGDSAFRNCTALTSVTIPDSVINIGKYAFEECTSVASVTIGSSVSSIGKSAFGSCTSLKSMIFKGNAPYCDTNWIDNHDPELIIYYYFGNSVHSNLVRYSYLCIPIKPSAPLNLVASATWFDYVIVKRPTTDGGSEIDYYVVYQDNEEIDQQ